MGIFDSEIKKTIADILEVKKDGDLCFALLSDTHISDEGIDTRSNICEVDKAVSFDFVCHLGNVTNGDNPQNISRKMFRRELDAYRFSVGKNTLYVTQGDTDGWRDERYIGQLVKGIFFDKEWYEDTSFIHYEQGGVGPKGKPYYYVDKEDIRLIFLCSYFRQYDLEIEFHQKYVGYDAEQIKWLLKEALNGCEGKKVLIFTHRIPLSRFECGKAPFIYRGNSTEAFLTVLQQAKERGVDIVGIFAGAYNADDVESIGDINHILIGHQLAKGRELGTIEQDLWDAVVLKKNERKVYLFRFGAGENRVVEY